RGVHTRGRGVWVLPLHGRRLELRGSTRDLVGAPLRLGAHAVEVRRLVEERRPDVLIAWGTRSAMACAAAIRTLSWRPPFIQQGNDLLTGPLIARAARETARRADLVVSLSATIARDLDPDRSLGERSAVAWPGVDIEAYAEIGPPRGAPHAVVLGAMVEPASCGPAEIVTPECGRLFVPGDARSAAEALVAVHSDPAELGAAGRVRAEESFRLEDSVVHYRELLDRVARPAAGKPAP